jgi:hypothetical protein
VEDGLNWAIVLIIEGDPMKKIKPILTVIEHVVLIAILSGAVGFYLGNSYGTTHQPVKTVPTASK